MTPSGMNLKGIAITLTTVSMAGLVFATLANSRLSTPSETAKVAPVAERSSPRAQEVTSQPPDLVITQEALDDLGATVGFFMGQQHSLDRIRETFADLIPRAVNVQHRFDFAFGSSLAAMDSTAHEVLGSTWDGVRAQIRDQVSSSFPEALSHQEAEDFLDQVDQRANGIVPERLLKTLLIFSPTFRRFPASEISDGYTTAFESNGDPKALGLRFRLDLAKSWNHQAGKRPHVLALFTSENGRGKESMLIMVREAPDMSSDEPTLQQVLEDLVGSPPEIPGYASINAEPVVLDGLPSVVIEYEGTPRAMDQAVDTRMIQFTTFWGNRAIILQGSVFTLPSNSDELNDRYVRMRPMFLMVANSLVLENRW